ncbi:Uncharacterised protein [Klebsiella pneumoniae]|nr:Uncharacterised protein [Klebsiella pneumoniae]
MEIEIPGPQQGKLDQKVEVPAAKAAPVLPERKRCRGRFFICHLFALPCLTVVPRRNTPAGFT